MKKLIVAVALLLVVAMLFTACGIRKTAKGKNAKIDYTGEASVGFYPKCPKCGHLSPKCYVNVSDGEYEEGTYICEKCYEIFEISIDRR